MATEVFHSVYGNEFWHYKTIGQAFQKVIGAYQSKHKSFMGLKFVFKWNQKLDNYKLSSCQKSIKYSKSRSAAESKIRRFNKV
mgnify:CR=1 FL=1